MSLPSSLLFDYHVAAAAVRRPASYAPMSPPLPPVALMIAGVSAGAGSALINVPVGVAFPMRGCPEARRV